MTLVRVLTSLWIAVTVGGCRTPTPAVTGCSATAVAKPRATIHGEGDHVAYVSGYYGVPILQKSLFWDGNGDDDNFGASAHALNFMSEQIAIGAEIVGSVYKSDGRGAFSAELATRLRWYAIADRDRGLFFDVTGGYLLSTNPVPAGGTEWNYTFSFGPGVEFAIGDRNSLLFGATYHHISNALGRQNDRNPSQNEGRIWVGYSWAW